MNHRRRAMGGFTLIEIMSATVIGSLVVASCVSVFAALSRADTQFAVRYDDTMDMERTYLAVQRALREIVVSSIVAAREEASEPRLVLSAERGLARMRPPGWESARVLVVGDERDQPQRFEMVVRRWPIESPTGRRLGGLRLEALGLDPDAFSLAEPVAMRGAFVLQPRGRTSTGRPIWRLLWQPMIAVRPTEEAVYFTPAPPAYEVVLAEGVLWCRWQVFFENERLLSHTATTVLDLPAYVELELELASGMMANWMFEIAWSDGPEFEPEQSGVAATPDEPDGGAVGGSIEGVVAPGDVPPTRLTPPPSGFMPIGPRGSDR
ncbi:MAG: hypothetical protein IID31_12170 [Planctomycetes bacterium]|nr:hypothetical protein [Planctomycetota bacterium]